MPLTLRERLLQAEQPRHAWVIGAGSWGTGIAFILGEAGIRTTLWGRNPELVEKINNTACNPSYLATCKLPDTVVAKSTFEGLKQADLVFLVVPSKAFRQTASALRASGQLAEGAVLVTATKGIEYESGKRMSEILEEELPGHPVAVLSGPNHAEEVGQRLPTAGVIGCSDEALAAEIQEVFTLPWLRTYTSNDLPGIETGGAVKNVFAIASGICDGLALGDNAKAALVTRGLAEMVRLGTELGGRPETFMGLSGLGDLCATCYSPHSRNYSFGHELGSGKSLEEVVAGMTMVAEGVPNTESIHAAARAVGVRTPIIDEMYAILYEGRAPADALMEFFARAPRPEIEASDLAPTGDSQNPVDA